MSFYDLHSFMIAVALLKSRSTARAGYREITCKTYASRARLNMQGAMIIQVSVFTWNFIIIHFIRENVKITEIPASFYHSHNFPLQ